MSTKKKILVIDDEPDAIRFVSAVLSEFESYTVIPAGEGKEGMKKAEDIHPDLIILDVMLPDIDGFELFYELQRQESTRDIPVIMLTGVAEKYGIHFSGKDMKGYMGKEPVDYIEKPMDPERILASVKHVLGESSKAGEAG